MKNAELTNEFISGLCMELSMLIQAGFTAYDSVLMIYDDESDDSAGIVFESMLPALEKGLPLSAALKESGYFPAYMIIMTEAGEKTGKTAEALEALSGHYYRQERLMAAIKSAVLYPLILLGLMVIVVLVLIIRVLPIFNGVFNQLGAQMPLPAYTLMQFGGYLADFLAVIAAVAAVLLLMAFIAWKRKDARESLKQVLINTFGNKGVFQKISVSRVVSVMALATASGIEPESAMELAVSTGGEAPFMKKKYEDFTEILRAGGNFAEAMLKAGFLSSRNSLMLSIGTKSGKMDAAMAEIAERCEREVQGEIDGIVGAIEPVLVIGSALVVGAVLLMVMLPLVSIMSAIG